MNPRSAIPRMGVGLGWRSEIAREILANLNGVDFVELLADKVLRGGRREWEEARDLARILPVIPHGVNLSIASADCLEHARYLGALKRLARWFDFPYYSDHFALTKSGRREAGHLTPLWLTRAQLAMVVRNVSAVQDRMGKPLVLENIAYPFEIPGAELRYEEFVNEACRRTGCGLLLDLANLHINAHNHGFDSEASLSRLRLENVVQIHLAGGIYKEKAWRDSHSRPVPEAVWDLFRSVRPRCPNLKAVVIERDSDFRGFSGLMKEVRRARGIFAPR